MAQKALEIEKDSLTKVLGNDIRVGNILFFRGRCYQVLKTMHTMPGKGGAYMQVEMKDVQSGTKLNERFRSAESVQKVFVEEISCNYLYDSKDFIVAINNETFEEVEIEKSLFAKQLVLLTENMEIRVVYAGSTIILVKLPKTIKVKIKSADPSAKGQTATSSFKNSIIECGLKIMVPQFVVEGDEIIIDTETLTYMSRA